MAQSLKTQEYETFIKDYVLDRFTALVHNLQETLKNDLIGIGVHGIQQLQGVKTLNTSNIHHLNQIG